ncbi:MAG: hypothetical protein U0V74_11020 [Chitinophagales bacterium]
MLLPGLTQAQSRTERPDSTTRKISALDTLSAEDLALLEEYKDSFDLELEDFKMLLKDYRKRQIDTSVSQLNRASHMEIGMDFVSRLLSNGRSSGLKGVAFYPSALYYHKLGFYAVAGLGFMTDSSISHSAAVPLLFISPGFSRLFFNKWQLNVGYTRSILFYGTSLQKNTLNNTISLYNSFDFWHYIELCAGVQGSWSSDKRTRLLAERYSVSIMLALKHDFHFFNFIGSKVFTLTPRINFLFGHDNSTFLVQGLFRPRIAHQYYFGFLNVEPSLSADWRIRNLDIYASFQLAIPFNEFDSDNKQRVLNPKHYYPYAEAGVKYLFRIKKKVKRTTNALQ